MLLKRVNTVANESLTVSMVIGAVGEASLEDLAKGRARLHLVAGQPIDLGVAAVGEHDPLLRIVEAHALGHVANGGIEARILGAQLLLALLQESVLLDQAGIEPLALGDVLVGAEQAAIGHRPAYDRDKAPVAQLDDLRRGAAESRQTGVDEITGFSIGVGAVDRAGLEDLPRRRARLHLLGRQPIEFREAVVGEHDPLLGIVQAHALGHVAYGGIEARILGGQLLLALPQELVLPGQLGIEAARAR